MFDPTYRDPDKSYDACVARLRTYVSEPRSSQERLAQREFDQARDDIYITFPSRQVGDGTYMYIGTLGDGIHAPVTYAIVRRAYVRFWVMRRFSTHEQAAAWILEEIDAGHVPPRLPEIAPEDRWVDRRKKRK